MHNLNSVTQPTQGREGLLKSWKFPKFLPWDSGGETSRLYWVDQDERMPSETDKRGNTG